MLDPAYVRDHTDEVRAALGHRGLDPETILAPFAELDAQRRALIPQVEGLKREQNTSGEEVARAKREGKDPSAIFAANKARGQQIKQLEAELDGVERRRVDLLMTVPNLPHESVPVGKSAADNKEMRRHGEPRAMDFEPKPHWDLGPALGILDFERATRCIGSSSAGTGAPLRRCWNAGVRARGAEREVF